MPGSANSTANRCSRGGGGGYSPLCLSFGHPYAYDTTDGAGRAYVEQQLYGLRPGGGVDLKPMPQPPTVQQLASAAVTKSEASKQVKLTVGIEKPRDIALPVENGLQGSLIHPLLLLPTGG